VVVTGNVAVFLVDFWGDVADQAKQLRDFAERQFQGSGSVALMFLAIGE